jgi:hypothetical protein
MEINRMIVLRVAVIPEVKNFTCDVESEPWGSCTSLTLLYSIKNIK